MNSIDQIQQGLLNHLEQAKSVAQAPIRASLEEGQASGSMGQAFADVFKAVDAQQHKASAMTDAVDAGTSDDLVGAMVESQKASLSFSALMQVRNKVAGAFEEIMRMPV